MTFRLISRKKRWPGEEHIHSCDNTVKQYTKNFILKMRKKGDSMSVVKKFYIIFFSLLLAFASPPRLQNSDVDKKMQRLLMSYFLRGGGRMSFRIPVRWACVS